MILVNTEGVISLANERVQTLLGISSADLIGQSFAALPDEILADMGLSRGGQEVLMHQLKTGDQSARNPQANFQSGDGHFIHRTHKLWMDEDGQSNGLLMIFTDETELHQIRDNITSMIVHDLRSPLTAVTASLRLLRDMAEPGDFFGDVVLQTTDISSRAIRKLLVLVNSLLDMSKMNSGAAILDREIIDVSRLILAVLAELKPLAREMEVLLDAPNMGSLALVDVDPDKIERVLYNLIDNAIKFTPEEGSVLVSASECQDDGKAFLQIEIADSGQGIDDEQKERIFDRYQQVSGSYARRRGTGLGLTYCKLTVEAHGGRIWIEDNPAGGSIFIFTLPIAHFD